MKFGKTNAKGVQMVALKADSVDQRVRIAPQRFVEATNAIGIITKSGRNGGGA